MGLGRVLPFLLNWRWFTQLWDCQKNLQAFWEAREGGKRDSKSWPAYLELDLEAWMERCRGKSPSKELSSCSQAGGELVMWGQRVRPAGDEEWGGGCTGQNYTEGTRRGSSVSRKWAPTWGNPRIGELFCFLTKSQKSLATLELSNREGLKIAWRDLKKFGRGNKRLQGHFSS